MRRSILIAIALVLVATAVRTAAAECTVSATEPTPPQGSALFATLEANGARIWQCSGGKLVNPNEVDAEVTMVGDSHTGAWDGTAWTGDVVPDGWTVVAGYAPGSTAARLAITDAAAGKMYNLDLDNTPVRDVNAANGTLPDARWTAMWTGEAPPGADGFSYYITRNNIVGGDTPKKCANATAETVESPYTATYMIYSCPKGGGAASGAAVASVWSAVMAVMTILVAVVI